MFLPAGIAQLQRRHDAASGDSPIAKLVAFYRFEEASGTRYDAHGSADFTENTGGVGSRTGVHGDAADFAGGTSQNLYLTSSGSVYAGTGSFSFCGLVWFDAVGGALSQYLFTRSDNGTSSTAQIDWGLFEEQASEQLWMRVVVGSTAYDAKWTAASLTTGSWLWVYGEYDSSANTVGVSLNNGTLVTTSVTGTINNGGDQVKFGRLSFSGSWAAYFDGALDEWAYFDSPLTADERTWMYNSGSGRAYSEL